ncbi:hypothetical protein [Streptomyces sp. NPDC090036]|uniref:hypothetical protein n=1 Tax=Streptomyces sp. NPDC090036 TaxID=3365926 RepID=UPI00380762DB
MSEPQPHEVALVRAGPEAAPEQTAVIRLVGLLPPDWTCTQQVTTGHISMLVRTTGAPGGNSADAVRTWLAGALADNSLRGWRAEGP